MKEETVDTILKVVLIIGFVVMACWCSHDLAIDDIHDEVAKQGKGHYIFEPETGHKVFRWN